MRIETELKLDFKDVLFKPKRSTLTSRKEVNLNRKFNFKHSSFVWDGIPIVSANMDTVSTIESGKILSENKMLTCLHKHYKDEEYINLFNSVSDSIYWAYSLGISDHELNRLNYIQQQTNNAIKVICIDVANGYTERFISFVSKVRDLYLDAIIIAGNVVTAEVTEQLILGGADIVKVGIGSGCFIKGTPILTDNGLKSIEDVEVGDKVVTHMGRERVVTNTFTHTGKDTLVNVNGIKATPNHEFYVVHKSDADKVNDENIHQYAKWIRADELTKEYFLLEVQ